MSKRNQIQKTFVPQGDECAKLGIILNIPYCSVQDRSAVLPTSFHQIPLCLIQMTKQCFLSDMPQAVFSIRYPPYICIVS
ncbi:hypothetical protein [Paenibacillus apiarius]|uniref:hypothetical protein n=1 Tax=Paenibacillus apiarius TaxID=46240 RepID=UPI00197DCC73|nr:hypothetical protein [Paenibacillus apiarius]MBN3526738.1 hypothetical protein [Paenibacillus apiarius]